MNKRERVLAAFQNKPVDRPPVGFWFHFLAEQGMGQPCIQAHLDYYNHIDVDMVKVMSDGYFPYPVPEIKTASDWRKLKPLEKDHPYIQEQLERARGVRAGLKDDMCVFYNVFAPFSSIRFGTSDELVMQHLKEDPDAVLYALDVIAKSNALLSELLVTEAGCDGLYYCLQGGEKDRFTAEQYRKYITPSDLYVLEHVNKFSDNNILHCCGWAGIQNRLENWQDYPAKVINWAVFIEDMDLIDGKRFFGGKPVLGGFDNRPGGVLFSGTREEVEAYTRSLVEKCGTTGVLLGGDCTLPATIEKQRIGWVVDTVKAMQA